MKKTFLSLFGLLLLLIPASTFAACSSNGTTIVYVNGIETTQQEANSDAALLSKRFLQYGGSPDTQIITGYNPTHLDGLGDEVESISQEFDTPISDYDFDTILTQIAPEVTTRKILLVGHSQGTFYTNEMYDYLVRNGVPKQSIAVYNIATPASVVAGDGTYLTSANDKVINYVRELDAEWSAPQALPANIIIPEESGYADTAWGGSLPSVYLDGAPKKIISDLQDTLDKLSTTGADSSSSCFTPPPLGLSYDVQKEALALADPAVASVEYAAIDTRNTIASVMDNDNNVIHAALADAYFSVVPKPDAQSAAGAFAVEKALYGSSLSVADYEALANGQNIPEVQTPAQDPPQAQPAAAKPEPQPVQAEPTQVTQPLQDIPVEKPEPNISPEAPQAVPTAPTLVPISPGYGGGAPIISPSVEATVSSNIETSASGTSQEALQPQDNAQAGATTTLSTSTGSSTDETLASTSSSAITTASSSAANSVQCPPIVGDGYFFDPSYEQAEYVGGLLRVHLRLLTPYNDGRMFRAKVLTIGSDCTFPAPSMGFGFPQTWFPAHIQYYSFRMASSTHWMLWDDENDVQVQCSYCEDDIPAGTSFVSFYALIDSGASELRTTPYPPTGP